MVYMDYNATTPVRPEVLEAFLPFYRERFGNPSSIHWAGRPVKVALEEAREKVAELLNCEPLEVVFTSGGSEADNMAIKGVATILRNSGNHIITTRIEHPAVLNSCLHLEQNGCRITMLDVDREGIPDLAELEAAITRETILISVMAANNETGVLMPVSEIGELAARRRIYFHCDAVQAAGKLPIDCQELQTGLLSISGHKLGGPKGIGALVVRKGMKLHPLVHGGSQERNRRAGTENVPGIVGLGMACELAQASLLSDEPRRLERLRGRLETGILARIPNAHVNGSSAKRLPNTSNLSFIGLDADSLLVSLDLQGIAASSGAACGSGTLKTSHVLEAMGLDPSISRGSVRFSLGRENTEADVDFVLEALISIVARLRTSGKK
ncbi:MAG: aminotransferase class V-fold PLP-dependent enzyme [Geobacteraceae bacterium]